MTTYDLKSLGDGAIVYFDPDSGVVLAEIKHVQGRGTYRLTTLDREPVEFVDEDKARAYVQRRFESANRVRKPVGVRPRKRG